MLMLFLVQVMVPNKFDTKEEKGSVIDWYFNHNLLKILFPDNVICGLFL